MAKTESGKPLEKMLVKYRDQTSDLGCKLKSLGMLLDNPRPLCEKADDWIGLGLLLRDMGKDLRRISNGLDIATGGNPDRIEGDAEEESEPE